MTEPIIYAKASDYLGTLTSRNARIAAIDSIIDTLLLTAADAASNDNISKYVLNDGQTIIQCEYKGAESIMKSIQAFRKLRNMYINDSNGRAFRLVDYKSI